MCVYKVFYIKFYKRKISKKYNLPENVELKNMRTTLERSVGIFSNLPCKISKNNFSSKSCISRLSNKIVFLNTITNNFNARRRLFYF